MSRALVALLLLLPAACGRIGYDATRDGGAVPDVEGFSLDAVVFGDGIAAAACGSTALMADDFMTAGAAPLFMQYGSGGLGINETNQYWELTFPASINANNYAGYKTVSTYTVEGMCGSIEVIAIPNVPAVQYFKLNTPGNNEQVEFFLQNGDLLLRTHRGNQVAILGSLPFDLAMHRFWRFRTQMGTTFWDTSPNGIDYVAHVSATFLTQPVVAFEIGGGAFMAVTNGGVARFDGARVTGP